MNNVLPDSLTANRLVFTNQYGNSTSPFEQKRATHRPGWMAVLVGGENHDMHWVDGEQFTNITFNAKVYDFMENDYLYITQTLGQAPDVVDMGLGNIGSVADQVPLTPDSDNLNWYFDSATNKLQYIISGKTTGSSRKKRLISKGIVDSRFTHVTVQPNIYRCYYENCVEPLDSSNSSPYLRRPANYYLLSQPNPCTNTTNSTIEIVDYADGVQCWVVVDSNIVTDHLRIKGILEFENSTTVSAITIQVLGGRMIAGFENSRFMNELVISLRGDHSTEGVAIDAGVTLGSKAIGCFGGCDFHGIPHDIYWTKLTQTAGIGDSTIYVEDNVDWQANDEIVIATTGYRATESEVRTISSVNGNAITLSEPLTYRHMGEEYTVNNHSYSMRAEVGLLTRNIKIVGESYADQDTQAFGARVLAGYIASQDITGWARVQDVEFVRSGQEGWTDSYDPRYGLAYLNTGTATEGNPSYVKGCAFKDSYSTGIGAFR